MTTHDIAEIVAQETGVSVDAMKSRTRIREVVEARQIAMSLAFHYKTGTCIAIAYYFGGRDHSTAIHSKQQVEDLRDTSRTFNHRYEVIKAACEQFMTSWHQFDPFSISQLSMAMV